MNRIGHIVVATLSSLVLSCSEGPEQSERVPNSPANPLIPDEWKTGGVAQVVGYRFRIPGEDAKGNHPTGNFSLLHDSGIDLTALEGIKVSSCELDAAQAQRLLECVFSDSEALPHVACYSPHQLFVFYGSDGSPLRAIEVCFLCNGLRTIPPLPETRWRKHDLVALAKLCDELGIWAEYKKIEDYVPVFTKGWKPDY